jgi:hypothetical protein
MMAGELNSGGEATQEKWRESGENQALAKIAS